MAQSTNDKNHKKGTLPSYKLALLQMVAYRNISEVVNDVLRTHELNTTKWIILNIVDAYPKQYRVTDIAEILQVEGTLVTSLVQELKQAGMLELVPHPSDKRARLVNLTPKGEQMIKPVEAQISQQLRPVIKGLSSKDVNQYFRFLKIFIANTNPLPVDIDENIA